MVPLQVKTYDPYEERQKCAENRCEAKKGDNRCDDECNTHFCDYDGGDCRIGLNPWKECTVRYKSGEKVARFRMNHVPITRRL